MSTCLDDINATLAEIRDAIGGLAVPAWSWSATKTIFFDQGGVIGSTGSQRTGQPADQSLIVYEAVLAPTSTGTAGNGVLILGLEAAPANAWPIGTALIFDSGVAVLAHVLWFTDGVARLYVEGGNDAWGASPSVALSTADTISLHLRYRTE